MQFLVHNCTVTNVFNMYFLYFLTHRFNFDIAYSIFNTVINIKVNMLKIIVNKSYYYLGLNAVFFSTISYVNVNLCLTVVHYNFHNSWQLLKYV